MKTKAERLASLLRELRGRLSQGAFAKKLNVNRSTVTLWESCTTWPEPKNLQKLATLKGWNLEQIEFYLEKGQIPSSNQLEEILYKVRLLPSDAVAQIAAVALETLAARTYY